MALLYHFDNAESSVTVNKGQHNKDESVFQVTLPLRSEDMSFTTLCRPQVQLRARWD